MKNVSRWWNWWWLFEI